MNVNEQLQVERLQLEHKQEKIWTRDFLLICFANFFIFLGFQMTLPTIPLFVEELGGNDQIIGLIIGVFTFSALLLRPYAGYLLEAKGRKLVYLTGLAIFVISVGSYAVAISLLFLFFMRVVQGIGWGLSTTASGTIATDLIPPKRRGEGMGYYGLSGNLAMALGPSLGLILVEIIPFSQLFAMCAVFGLIALLLSWNIHYKQVEKSDLAIKPMRDFYEKTALQPSILMFFISASFAGLAAFLPLYADLKGIEGIQWFFTLNALSLMLTRPFSGRLYDMMGHGVVFIPGAVMIITSLCLLAWLPNSFALYIAAILNGTGFGTLQPALQAWAVEKAPMHRKGMANATFFSSFDLGIGLGAIFFGQVGHWFGYGSIYLCAAVSTFISILLYLYLMWRNRAEKTAN